MLKTVKLLAALVLVSDPVIEFPEPDAGIPVMMPVLVLVQV